MAEIRNQDLAIGRRQVMRGEDGLAQGARQGMRIARQQDQRLLAAKRAGGLVLEPLLMPVADLVAGLRARGSSRSRVPSTELRIDHRLGMGGAQFAVKRLLEADRLVSGVGDGTTF